MNELCRKAGDRLEYFIDKKIYHVKKAVPFPFRIVLEEEGGDNELIVISKSYFGTFFQPV